MGEYNDFHKPEMERLGKEITGKRALLAELRIQLEIERGANEAKRGEIEELATELSTVKADNERYLDRIRELTSMCDEIYDKLKASEKEVERLTEVADKCDRDFWKMKVENTRLRERNRKLVAAQEDGDDFVHWVRGATDSRSTLILERINDRCIELIEKRAAQTRETQKEKK